VIITIIIILIILGGAGYYLYQNLPGQNFPFQITQNFEPKQLENISNTIIQFYPNMRFNHNNLTYAFENCEEEKQDRMKQAFSQITEKTIIITFRETIQENADILIGCSEDYLEKEEHVFIAGEGGPSEVINSTLYPTIIKGKILIYDSTCESPLVELHELLHVFGFDHINNSNYIMYPYVDCNMKLNKDYTDYLMKLYSITPLPELYFDYLNASKEGPYLNFEVSVGNQGLIDTQATLIISSNQKQIKTFELEEIPLGAKKTLTVQNLKLPSRSTTQVTFKIQSNTNELDNDNNILTATISEQ